MPLGMRREGADVKSTCPAAETERTESDPIRNLVFANLAHESCVLIKLVLRLLHCRIGSDWTLVAFDMSPQQLMWFAGALTDKK